MEIREATEYDADLVASIGKLVPQLSKSAAPPTEDLVRSIIDSDATRLLVAKDADTILGMLTVVIFPLPTGIRAWIEDVIVDEAGRGKGVGEALNNHALQLARTEGAKTVDLTSRPSREAANRLYQRIGFIRRETNIYRIELER